MAGILGIPPKYCHDFIANALPKKPHGTSPKEASERKKGKKMGLTSTPLLSNKPPQQKTLPQKSFPGYLAIDGQYYPTKEKAKRVTRAIEEKDRFVRWLECREKHRLDQLKSAAKAGDVIFTKHGVFESKPCPSCGILHKVPSLSSVDEPCPCSKLASHHPKKPTPPANVKVAKVRKKKLCIHGVAFSVR